jgi:hypothetical protein
VGKRKGGKGKWAYEELRNRKIVHIHPHRTPPIILSRPIKLILLAQTPQPKLTPQLLFVTQ